MPNACTTAARCPTGTCIPSCPQPPNESSGSFIGLTYFNLMWSRSCNVFTTPARYCRVRGLHPRLQVPATRLAVRREARRRAVHEPGQDRHTVGFAGAQEVEAGRVGRERPSARDQRSSRPLPRRRCCSGSPTARCPSAVNSIFATDCCTLAGNSGEIDRPPRTRRAESRRSSAGPPRSPAHLGRFAGVGTGRRRLVVPVTETGSASSCDDEDDEHAVATTAATISAAPTCTTPRRARIAPDHGTFTARYGNPAPRREPRAPQRRRGHTVGHGRFRTAPARHRHRQRTRDRVRAPGGGLGVAGPDRHDLRSHSATARCSPPGDSSHSIVKVLHQPDGKIIAISNSFGRDVIGDMAVTRFLPDGSLDTSFGVDGTFSKDRRRRGNEWSAATRRQDRRRRL